MTYDRPKIILVDDNSSSLLLGRKILKPFYEVYPATSAEKMFEILEYIEPEMILLDVMMPGMNGYEAIEKLKADPRFYDIPVMFLTSQTDYDSELHGLELGAVDYVSKPFHGPLLLKRIDKELTFVRQTKELELAKEELSKYSENLEDIIREKQRQILQLNGV